MILGASNHRLDEIIRDETGIRRFFELLVKAAANRSQRFDWTAMWSSVQPEDVDPLENLRDDVANAQAGYRVAGVVEDWLNAQRQSIRNGEYTTAALYDSFRLHRAEVTMGIDYQARTMQAFSSELRRVIEQRTELNIRKVRHSTGFRWMVGSLFLREVA